MAPCAGDRTLPGLLRASCLGKVAKQTAPVKVSPCPWPRSGDDKAAFPRPGRGAPRFADARYLPAAVNPSFIMENKPHSNVPLPGWGPARQGITRRMPESGEEQNLSRLQGLRG